MYKNLIIYGHILNPINDTKCENFPLGALHLVYSRSKQKYLVKDIGNRRKIKVKDAMIHDLGTQLIIPPFFDMHFHWVQDDVREMPKANLLKWLDKYTFPAERKFKNKVYAKRRAKEFFQRLVSVGTLGGACYSSIHEHALEYAQNEVIGDFVIGNVLMTMNSPKYLTQTKKEAVGITSKLARKYKDRYAVTPRFAIATDPETMLETAKIAKKHKCFIQTHLSETKNEIDFVTTMYKDFPKFSKVETYTDIYKKVGMLGPRTIMGHGIHLQQSELESLSKSKTAIAHCPTSNAPIIQKGLGSGLFDFKLIEKNGIRWALASDIGGGPFLSMLDVIRSFVDQNEKAGVKGATYTKALYRSTLAGAEILKLDKRIGNLSPGKEANFLVLKAPRNKASLPTNELLRTLIASGRRKRSSYDRKVEKVYYGGKLIFSK